MVVCANETNHTFQFALKKIKFSLQFFDNKKRAVERGSLLKFPKRNWCLTSL